MARFMGLALVHCANQKQVVAFVKTEQAKLRRVLAGMEARGLVKTVPVAG